MQSSKEQLEKSFKEQGNVINDTNVQLENALKEHKSVLKNQEGAQEIKDLLSKEQTKTKEVESKVEELTELILTRDETISQLNIEVKANLENLTTLKDKSQEELSSRNNEIDKLKQDLSTKVFKYS